jgi:hypothetical protein
MGAAACGGYSKETVALYRDNVGLRVPNQQRLVALSTDEAVERLDFAALAGKKVVVELSGIFPHSRDDLMGYVQAQVEGKLARSGAIVVESGGALIVPSLPGQQPAVDSVGAIRLDPDADYRVVIGVSWGGVDTHDKKTVNTSLLLKQVGTGAGGALGGALLIGNEDSTIALIGAIVALAAPAGALVWYFIQPPTLHIYRLIGRVRLTVTAMPLGEGTAFQTIGEGQTEILIDPTAEEGFILQ